MPKKAGKRAHGEGTLYQRADGSWEAKVTIGRDHEGKLIRKSFYGKSQGEAKEKRDTYLTEVKTGTYIEPDKLPFSKWVDQWLELFVKPKVKMATYSKYQINFRTHIKPGFGHIELQKLSTEHIQKFYNEKAKTHSSSVLAIIHQIINGSLKQAVRQKLLLNNPAEFTVRPSVKYKEVDPMTPSEVEKYLDAAKPDRLYAAFLLDLFTGLRRGELLALRWSDIDLLGHKWSDDDLQGGILSVNRSLGRVETYEGNTVLMFSEPKTENSKREIPLLPSIVKELKRHKARQNDEALSLGEGYQRNDLIFCTEISTPLDPGKLRKKHKALLKKTGLREELRIHDLRHTFGTMLAQAGENPKNLQMLMGHADIRTTMGTYCHTNMEDKKRAVEKLTSIISF